MLIYILLLILLVIILIFSNLFKKRTDKIVIFLIFVLLFFVSSFRGDQVGTDTSSYLIIFNDFSNGFLSYSRLEIGFQSLMYLTKLFFNNQYAILYTTSFLILFFTFLGVKKNSRNFWFSIFLFVSLYYFYNSFNGIRQYIAIAIIFYGITFINKQKPFFYLFFVIFASLFHTSALIFLPFVLFSFHGIKKNLVVLYTGFVLLLVLNFQTILYLLIRFFPEYSSYLNTEYATESGGVMSVILLGLILVFGAFVRFLYKAVNKKHLYQLNILTIMILTGFALSVITLSGFKGLNRIIWYFSMFSILFIPNHLVLISDKNLRLIVTMAIVFFSVAFNIYFLIQNQQRIVPYIFNWGEYL
jgi:hypothetical protein